MQHFTAMGTESRSMLLGGSLLLSLVGCYGDDSKDTSYTPPESSNVPIANAGPDQSVPAGEPATMDGTSSYDPTGETLIYHWSLDHLPSGSSLSTMEAPFSDNHSADASTSRFTPDLEGTYVVELTVNNGIQDSEPDFAIVTATSAEILPVADAGEDQTVPVGTSASLDGSGSYDPLGRSLTYQWSLVSTPDGSSLSSSSIGGSTTVTAVLAPDVKGEYLVSLVVDNGSATSDADAAIITATSDNSAPTANAGEDLATPDCTSVVLDCSASVDPDGDTLTYYWAVQEKPASSSAGTGSFSDRTSATPTFWVDVAGSYILSCSVNDGEVWSSPDQMGINASERKENNVPVVEAGSDQNAPGGTADCVEDGYGYACEECPAINMILGKDASIFDKDADPMESEWTVVEGDATIADPSQTTTTVSLTGAEPVEPGACEDTSYVMQLSATDCPGAVSTDTVTFTVTCCGVMDTAGE